MKGDKGDKCNRTVCNNRPAKYYNHSTRKYYCTACAFLINDYNKQEAQDFFGHDLCTLNTEVEYDN